MCFWFMQILLIGWLIDWCARSGRIRVGYMLAAAVAGIFYWPVIAYSGYVDGGVALFTLAGLTLYFDWLLHRDKPVPSAPEPKARFVKPFHRLRQAGFGELMMAGLFIGTACASKYSALPAAALIFLHLIWLLIADRGRNRTTLAFLGFAILFLVPVIPWYGRNIMATGNPVFPFLRSVFGGPEPTIADDISTWSNWGLATSIRNYLIRYAGELVSRRRTNGNAGGRP